MRSGTSAPSSAPCLAKAESKEDGQHAMAMASPPQRSSTPGRIHASVPLPCLLCPAQQFQTTHTRTQHPSAPSSFSVTASWPMYIPPVSCLSNWGSQDLTTVAGCRSPNLCHSFAHHPSAATPQSLLQSSGWLLAEWGKEKVDYHSLSVPNLI